jgi:hypothetical protein
MTKAEKLQMLDEAVLDKMIGYLQSNQVDMIKELGTAVQYLRANQVVEPPSRGELDPIEARKRKLEEVKKRRERQDQEDEFLQ